MFVLSKKIIMYIYKLTVCEYMIGN